MALALIAALLALRGLSLEGHLAANAVASQAGWWLGCVPFVVLLGAMAVLPLIPATEHWWEQNMSKLALSAALGLGALGWLAATLGSSAALHAAAHGAAELSLIHI